MHLFSNEEGTSHQTLQSFLSGPGGVGKSHVISFIHRDTVKLLHLSGQVEPEDVTALLTSKLNTQPITMDKLKTIRTNLQLLIIDEVSMVRSNMLLQIHKRLQS